jgi:serine/threonine-protein kinase HipA
MKIGEEYKLSRIGLRQWQKFARETRVDMDEVIAMLTSMVEQLPDEVSTACDHARKEGLDNAVVEELAVRLIERANICRGHLSGTHAPNKT